jgi:hypothetical protein
VNLGKTLADAVGGPETAPWLGWKLVSAEPLVTLSRRSAPLPLGALSLCPAALLARPALHLVQPTWHISAQVAAEMARAWAPLATLAPQARLAVLANTETEAWQLNRVGVPATMASELIFVDERPFLAAPEAPIEFAAVYNAALADYKRHTLACEVDPLALLYRADGDEQLAQGYARVRRWLPRARFLNHELGDGEHRGLTAVEVAAVLRRAGAGLALSKVEGAMRASIEYLYAGLPVVTTHSEGGRARYLFEPHARRVDPSSAAVAAAVADFAAERPDPEAIRARIQAVVAVERRAFECWLDHVVGEIFGAPLPAEDFLVRYQGYTSFKSPEMVRSEISALPG